MFDASAEKRCSAFKSFRGAILWRNPIAHMSLECRKAFSQHRDIIENGPYLALAREGGIRIYLKTITIVTRFHGLDQCCAHTREGVQNAKAPPGPRGHFPQNVLHKGCREPRDPGHPSMKGAVVILAEGRIAESGEIELVLDLRLVHTQ